MGRMKTYDADRYIAAGVFLDRLGINSRSGVANTLKELKKIGVEVAKTELSGSGVMLLLDREICESHIEAQKKTAEIEQKPDISVTDDHYERLMRIEAKLDKLIDGWFGQQ